MSTGIYNVCLTGDDTVMCLLLLLLLLFTYKLQVAESTKNEQLLSKYIARYAATLIKDGSTLQALRLYKKYGAPPTPQNFNIYKRIALDILTQPFTGLALFIEFSELRDMLYDLIIGFRVSVILDLVQIDICISLKDLYFTKPQNSEI